MRKLLPSTFAVIVLSLLMLGFSVGVQAPVTIGAVRITKPIRTWTGTASWYGPGFDGRTTASGQPYDMNAATAAHPWLPLGSIVRVVNTSTGQSQVARINDRGPYLGDRELDVSYMLAGRLGILEPGTAHVRIELLEQPRRRLPTP